MQDYREFIEAKSQLGNSAGFDPLSIPCFLFDFQRSLVDWSIRKGRAAIFADCGLGKTPIQLVWSDNVVRKTNRPVLVLTPLAVAAQTVQEAAKFSIDARRSSDGKIDGPRVYVTNYQRLHYFNPSDFAGLVCDESSILKNFDGATKAAITDFMRKMPYRLLCTATAAPNDFIELGTSAEALGELGHMDMLARFFKNDQNSINPNRLHGDGGKWRFKKHAESHFWRWVCSWARAVRKPSDLGFDDGRFLLPPLVEAEHVVKARTTRPGWLFDAPAANLGEEREERRRTVAERCEKAAELAMQSPKAILWCHLNDEGDFLERIIPGAIQVSGKDDDDEKERKLIDFAEGDAPYLVTKHKIGALGLNLQRCAHVVSFATHSFEQHYQGIRRCWRFGQTKPVRVDIVSTDGEAGIMANMQRKAVQAGHMFASLVAEMNNALKIDRMNYQPCTVEVPSWM